MADEPTGPMGEHDDLQERIAEALPIALVLGQSKANARVMAAAVLAVLEGWVPPQLEQVGWRYVAGIATNGDRLYRLHSGWEDWPECPQEHHRTHGPCVPVFRLRVEGERE